MNDDADLVYDGILHQVYTWEQTLFDDSTTTFEAVRRMPSVQLLVVKDNKCLLLEEEQPSRGTFTGLPGGRFETFEESSQAAAKRELKEELPLTGSVKPLFTDTFQSSLRWTTHYFTVEPPFHDNKPNRDPGERITMSWHAAPSFVDAVAQDSFRNTGFARRVLALDREETITTIEDLLDRLRTTA